MGAKLAQLQQDHAREMESSQSSHNCEVEAMQEKHDHKVAELNKLAERRRPQVRLLLH